MAYTLADVFQIQWNFDYVVLGPPSGSKKYLSPSADGAQKVLQSAQTSQTYKGVEDPIIVHTLMVQYSSTIKSPCGVL
ncbi:hypothetical protein M378DRAFT_18267 [Amanita muscaria Koide BX008]|uniref:Uncharacterized protein n=1 Tax=Amanita muscaria (strain Koide BX008) TaxID=946122 RepID=A0A0C2SMB0_AMAMK|nr:hypothetical protein M378DRAFT_18267 [Amanita muscaria Koide BX008]